MFSTIKIITECNSYKSALFTDTINANDDFLLKNSMALQLLNIIRNSLSIASLQNDTQTVRFRPQNLTVFLF